MRRAVTALVMFLTMGASAAAADSMLKPFVGSYEGAGIAVTDKDQATEMEARDLIVQISETDKGFELSWTTIMRAGTDPDSPEERGKARGMSFVATEQPGVYQQEPLRDPFSPEGFGWAHIDGNVMIVRLFHVNPKTGKYSVQTYQRTVSDNGMDLVYTRLKNGDLVRTVTATLARRQ